MHNLFPALSGIGELHYLKVPAGRSGSVANIPEFSKQIYNFVIDHKPDLIYCYVRNRWVAADPFLRIKNELHIPSINLSLDDTHKFHLVADIAHAFTLNQTSAKSALIHYARNNAQAIYLPEGANPEIHTLHPVKEKDIDVCFIGKKYGNRASVIQAIKDAGINVVVRGDGWAGGQVSFEAMLDLYSRSKIVLGFAKTSSSSRTYSIKGRDFEVLMCGAFYLCEHNPELCDWFRPNREIVFWDETRDLIPKIKFYLMYPERRNTVACMGHFKAATEHTWMDRFEALFRYMHDRLAY